MTFMRNLNTLSLRSVAVLLAFGGALLAQTPDQVSQPKTLLRPGTTHTPLGDFVPCIFSPGKLIEMHSLSTPSRSEQERRNTTPVDLETATRLVQKTYSELAKLNDRMREGQSFYDPDKYLVDLRQAFNNIIKPQDLVGMLPNQAVSEIRMRTEQVVNQLNSKLASNYIRSDRTASANPVDIAKPARELLANTVAVVNEVGASLLNESRTTYEPPDDVSCSMSVLTWKETSDVFGRRVANTYVAIQVTVRNLNSKNEFLIHDIQVAIDTGVDSKYFSRFQSGRDKLLVRAVAQRGQSEDRRNLALNALQAGGAIAGSSSIAAGTTFKTAVAVFQGAFIPGYTTLFPDHTVEQINHINDLVFSASSTSKVMVPVQGSVPLVTFISEKPIEQLPFASCGDIHKTASCSPLDTGDSPGRTEVYPHNATPPDQPWKSIKYKDWRGAAINILQERAFVVIGGVHIQQLTKNPTITNVDCPMLAGDTIDLSQTNDDMVTCNVSGADLDAIAAVALEKGARVISGKIKPANDGNSAELEFARDDLSDLDGAYTLMFVDKSGTKTPSKNIIQLRPQPLITGLLNAQLIAAAGGKVTLVGKRLDLIGEFDLVPDSFSGEPVKNSIVDPKPSASDTSATVVFPALPPGTYHLRYIETKQKKMIDLKSLTVQTAN